MYYEQEAYQKMYYYLFNAVEDAVNTLSDSPVGHYSFIDEVVQNLISAQNTCEDIYLDSERKECDLMENVDLPYSERNDHLEKLYFAEKQIHAMNMEYLDRVAKELNFNSDNIDITE